MKKAQVLSALALAFALGVAVIPTASTYASIDTETADNEQIQSVYDEIDTLNDEYQKLQTNMHFNNYSYLYNLIEGENGGATLAYASTAIADKIAKWEKGSWLDLYNDFWAKNNSAAPVNSLIGDYNQYLANNADAIAALKKNDESTIDSTSSRINPLTKAASVSAAYKNVEKVLASIDSISTILSTNYNTGTATTGLQTKLTAIKDEITGSQTWYTQVEASALNIFESNDGTNTIYVDLVAAANNIKSISKDTYDKLFQESAWTTVVNNTPAIKSTATGMQMIEAFKVLTKTARGLDKWSFVGPVVEGKTKTDAVIGSNRVVSYDVALKDTADFKAAIVAFINGKTDNSGTGEGENKPGDDNKDPNAPDTGILADGEANASTTVAMVAGIATALTAAGAGVVAYRNARRSTRK